MVSFISIFIPSIFGCRTLYNLTDKKIKKYDLIYYYFLILLFTNVISIVISKILFGVSGNLENTLLEYPIFSVKYIIVSVVVSVFLGTIVSILKKHISVSLEVVKNEKNK